MPINVLLLQLVIFIIFYHSQIFVTSSEEENRLVHYLFAEQGYNPLVRPAQFSNETVVVGFGLLLVQLIHVCLSIILWTSNDRFFVN
jgi:hypothetical protein